MVVNYKITYVDGKTEVVENVKDVGIKDQTYVLTDMYNNPAYIPFAIVRSVKPE